MRIGEVRRFNDKLVGYHIASVVGRTFLVINVVEYGNDQHQAGTMDFIIDGKVYLRWGYPWVEQNSEVISEGR